MKKLFTLFAAALATLSLTAQEFTFTDSNLPAGWACSDKGSTEFSDGTGAMKVKTSATLSYTFDEAVELASIDFVFAFNSKDAKSADITVKNASGVSVGTTVIAQEGQSGSKIKQTTNIVLSASGVKTFELVNSSDKEFLIGYIKFNVVTCEAPTTPLSLSASKTSDIIVGDVITFSTEGGNGTAVKFFDGDTEISSPWTATKGSHSITAVQEDNAGVCGATTEALVLNVITHDPVTAATVSAPKTDIIIGEEVVLTCAAENADTFQWFKGENAIAGATEASYSFSSDAAGDFTFYCNASNAYTATPVKSNVLTIRVTTLCGELIKATHLKGKTATVTGLIGGEYDKNTQDNGKLGSDNHYFGVKLASGTFQEGDVVTIHATTVSTIVQIFSDKGETMLNEGNFDENGIYTYELEAATEWVYLYRTSAAGKNMNPTVDYISVERPCNGGEPSLKVSDASITLRATAQEPTVSKVVKFTGKNLPAGTYNFAINPAAAGLSVSPTSVTVSDNGKLNQEVTVTFAATADAGMAMAELSLAVDTLSQKVLIAYSASLSKEYGESIDFEQFVLDNGMSGNFAGALEAKHYIFSANGMSLDSLDSSKENNNEPYLGLKIKAANAYVGCWLKQNDTIQIKFGKVSADVKFTAGTNELTKTPADLAEDFEFIAENAAVYVKFETTTADAVVVKHINILRAEEPIEGFEDVIDAARTATKIIRNGQLLIIRDGKVYTVQGVEVR